jgi:hypothetical protein
LVPILRLTVAKAVSRPAEDDERLRRLVFAVLRASSRLEDELKRLALEV